MTIFTTLYVMTALIAAGLMTYRSIAIQTQANPQDSKRANTLASLGFTGLAVFCILVGVEAVSSGTLSYLGRYARGRIVTNIGDWDFWFLVAVCWFGGAAFLHRAAIAAWSVGKQNRKRGGA